MGAAKDFKDKVRYYLNQQLEDWFKQKQTEGGKGKDIWIGMSVGQAATEFCNNTVGLIEIEGESEDEDVDDDEVDEDGGDPTTVKEHKYLVDHVPSGTVEGPGNNAETFEMKCLSTQHVRVLFPREKPGRTIIRITDVTTSADV